MLRQKSKEIDRRMKTAASTDHKRASCFTPTNRFGLAAFARQKRPASKWVNTGLTELKQPKYELMPTTDAPPSRIGQFTNVDDRKLTKTSSNIRKKQLYIMPFGI